VPDAPQHIKIKLPEVRDRNRIAREALAALPTTTPRLEDINATLDDTPVLISLIRTLATELTIARRNAANLAAAGRAALTAQSDGERDPLYYLRDELRAQGYLPPDIWGRS
jgi:hypothetical protein